MEVESDTSWKVKDSKRVWGAQYQSRKLLEQAKSIEMNSLGCLSLLFPSEVLSTENKDFYSQPTFPLFTYHPFKYQPFWLPVILHFLFSGYRNCHSSTMLFIVPLMMIVAWDQYVLITLRVSTIAASIVSPVPPHVYRYYIGSHSLLHPCKSCS